MCPWHLSTGGGDPQWLLRITRHHCSAVPSACQNQSCSYCIQGEEEHVGIGDCTVHNTELHLLFNTVYQIIMYLVKAIFSIRIYKQYMLLVKRQITSVNEFSVGKEKEDAFFILIYADKSIVTTGCDVGKLTDC